MEAETQEAIILRWISPQSGKKDRFMIAFEEWIEFVDGIRQGDIKRSQGRLKVFE